MNNIKFDNPLLLIVGIPLLLITIISFIIAIKKDNKTTNNVISLVCHIVICVFVTLALAKTTYERVITETNIYVLADISYSSNKNLDQIDEYIKDIEENAPRNSKVGIITFGKDYELLVKPGDNLVSVKNSKVDDSATNIVSALEYAATLFKDNVIKRIVIISDGEETKQSNIVSVVQSLSQDNIYIDAIYLDNNIKDTDKEVQINQIEYTEYAYLENEEKVHTIVQSSYDTKAILTLYCNNEVYSQKAISLTKGYNTFTFDLKTDISGTNKYELKIEAENDYSSHNNSYLFTQKVSDKIKMLFITDSKEDKSFAEELYGEKADIDFYINKKEVPYTVEELCIYDEFVLSNVDIRTLYNASQFISSLDVMVSEFGKSLITFGNTYIQNNEEDETLTPLGDMLPVKFGKPSQDDKLVAILIDISRSMEFTEKLKIAKAAVCSILDNLDDEVNIVVAAFYGDVGTVCDLTKASERETIKEKINELDVAQGTFLGAGMQYIYDLVTDLPFSKKEVLLISDGLPYREQSEAAIAVAQKMLRDNIVLSTILAGPLIKGDPVFMKELSTIAKGYYYAIEELDDVESLVLNEVLNSLNEVILEDSESSVNIKLEKDDLVDGIESLPNVLGLYNNTKKSSAKVVLEATYTDSTNTSYNVPLYAYWNYGNGKVSSFASTLSGNWVSYWHNDSNSMKVFDNVLKTNIPEQKIDSAFIVETNQNGTDTDIVVNAPSFNQKASLFIKVTYPNKTILEKELVFDSQNYVTTIDTSLVGEYILELSYTFGVLNYKTEYILDISYMPEYNSFTIFEASNLYHMVSADGEVSEDGKLSLENDNSIIRKYIIDFTPLFMIICVVLFVVDVMVRKLRWQDIKSLFKKTVKKGSE